MRSMVEGARAGRLQTGLGVREYLSKGAPPPPPPNSAVAEFGDIDCPNRKNPIWVARQIRPSRKGRAGVEFVVTNRFSAESYAYTTSVIMPVAW